jgi:hypothetical protein
VHQDGDFAVDTDAVEDAIEAEIEHYAALGQVLRLRRRKHASSALPISPARLESFRDDTLERIFRLLGLRYDQRDLYDAYLGVTSADAALRDSAIEFVDNLVDYDTRRRLLPLLDDPDAEQAVEVGESFFDLRIREGEDARRYLRGVDDPRLAALLDGAAAGNASESPSGDGEHPVLSPSSSPVD